MFGLDDLLDNASFQNKNSLRDRVATIIGVTGVTWCSNIHLCHYLPTAHMIYFFYFFNRNKTHLGCLHVSVPHVFNSHLWKNSCISWERLGTWNLNCCIQLGRTAELDWGCCRAEERTLAKLLNLTSTSSVEEAEPKDSGRLAHISPRWPGAGCGWDSLWNAEGFGHYWSVFTIMWRSGTIPMELQTRVVVPIYKNWD